jgi:hypothetical protein
MDTPQAERGNIVDRKGRPPWKQEDKALSYKKLQRERRAKN